MNPSSSKPRQKCATTDSPSITSIDVRKFVTDYSRERQLIYRTEYHTLPPQVAGLTTLHCGAKANRVFIRISIVIRI